ncbi:unannotated protein [freshwater metagenome]|uniref:Unannotated protein n=1 Tax=freshwater metagenome TaxID=449393 RepID=A0A6J7H0U6_9ZZZZ|nr:30S ribosomal protein S18 [Actinomycetota bacterium]MSY78183.1 30S ribosomal protein S18 [Actinomycetota bacterium]MTA63030.1 30S ribosomal protein S18 [Actinomycetota bacterium]
MAKTQPKRSPKGKDNGRKFKKKVSILNSEKVEYVDWKDVNLLRRFVSDRAKIRARRVTGNDVQQQSAIAMAIKNAREMALIPYANRVTTQRGGRSSRGDRDGDDRRERRDRSEDSSEQSTAPSESASEFTEIDIDATESVAVSAETTGGEE